MLYPSDQFNALSVGQFVVSQDGPRNPLHYLKEASGLILGV